MGSLIIRAAEATTAALREEWLGEQESLLHGHLLAGSSPSSRPAAPPTRLASTVPAPGCWGYF